MFRSFRHEMESHIFAFNSINKSWGCGGEGGKALREFQRAMERNWNETWKISSSMGRRNMAGAYFRVSVTSICVPWGARQNWLSRAVSRSARRAERSVILINYPTCQSLNSGKWKWDAKEENKYLNVSILSLEYICRLFGHQFSPCARGSLAGPWSYCTSLFVSAFVLIQVDLAGEIRRNSLYLPFCVCSDHQVGVGDDGGYMGRRRRRRNSEKTGSWKKSATGILYTFWKLISYCKVISCPSHIRRLAHISSLCFALFASLCAQDSFGMVTVKSDGILFTWEIYTFNLDVVFRVFLRVVAEQRDRSRQQVLMLSFIHFTEHLGLCCSGLGMMRSSINSSNLRFAFGWRERSLKRK